MNSWSNRHRRQGVPAAVLAMAVVLAAGCDSPEPESRPPATAPTPTSTVADPLSKALAESYQTESQLRLRKLSVQASGFRDAINGLLTETSDEWETGKIYLTMKNNAKRTEQQKRG